MAGEKHNEMVNLFANSGSAYQNHTVRATYRGEGYPIYSIGDVGWPLSFPIPREKQPLHQLPRTRESFVTESEIENIVSDYLNSIAWRDRVTSLIEEAEAVKVYEERIKKRLYEAGDLLAEYLDFVEDFDKDDSFSEFIDIMKNIWSDRKLLNDSQQQLVSLIMDYATIYEVVTLTDEQIFFIRSLLDILNEGKEIAPEYHYEIIKTGLQYGFDVSKLSRTEKGWYAEEEE